MAVHNSEIAALFLRLADLLEIEGANTFRVRAYRNAARVIEDQPTSMASMVAEGADLSELPGIGEDLAAKIAEIVGTGRLGALEDIMHRTPRTLTDLLDLPGLGPKRVRTLYQKLRIRSLDDLRQAAQRGKVQALAGFGAKLEKAILQAIERKRDTGARIKLPVAEEFAAPLIEALAEVNGVGAVEVAGSFRRRRETIGDLDFVVAGTGGKAVVDALTHHEDVAEIAAAGTTRATVILRGGLQVDLRVVAEESFGAALLYFTGSKAHNIALRAMAAKKGFKINEYGLFKGQKRLAGRTEKDMYRRVGLPWIAPELRENRGEIEAAKARKLPHLVRTDDLVGDLHVHTDASDGRDALNDMVRAARERGYRYLAITDHSQHAAIAKGQTPRRLAAQIARIDKLNAKLGRFRVLKSAEVDILEDGSLDFDDAILADLDIVVCAIHSGFRLSRAKQTDRILRAMDNPRFHILSHPTGRLIGEREAYDVDLERIIEGAAERGCFLELNAQPDRLDLDDHYCRLAKERGVKISIGSDAHHVGQLDFVRYGIGQARRGWLEPDDILNTRPWGALKRLLKRG